MGKMVDDIRLCMQSACVTSDDLRGFVKAWPEISKDSSIQIRAELYGSVEAALARELVIADEVITQLEMEVAWARSIVRKYKEGMSSGMS